MKRYSAEEKRSILEDLAVSGLNRAAFCRSRSLCYASVGVWAKQATEQSWGANDFVEVDLSAPVRSVEVWLPGQVCVRFDRDTPMALVADFCRRVSSC